MHKKVVSRLRSVTQKRYRGQFPVTLGYVSRLRSPVTHGYTNTKPRPGPGTLGYKKRNQSRFPVTLGYVSRSRSPFPVKHGYESRLRSPVPGYVWLHKLAKRRVTDRFHGYAKTFFISEIKTEMLFI